MFHNFAFVIFAALLGVAVIFAALTRMGRFYAMAGTASAQIQACGLSLQIGAWIVGWAPTSWFIGRRGPYFPSRLIVMQPAAFSPRVLFQVLVLGHGLSFSVAGGHWASSYSWPGPGFRIV